MSEESLRLQGIVEQQTQQMQAQQLQMQQQAQQIEQLLKQQHELMMHIQAVSTSTATAPSTPSAEAAIALPRVKPAKPTTFDGARKGSSARTWLNEMKRYLDFMSMGEGEESVKFASVHLRGNASVWYEHISKQAENQLKLKRWKEFETLFLENYQPLEATRTARAQLYHLKQRGSVSDYCDQFRVYLNQIDDMNLQDQIFFFTEGLQPHIAREVNMHIPKTLQEAMSIASRADIEYRNVRRNYSGRREFSYPSRFPPAGYTAANAGGRASGMPYPPVGVTSTHNPVPMELGKLKNTTETDEEQEWNVTNDAELNMENQSPEGETDVPLAMAKMDNARLRTSNMYDVLRKEGRCFNCRGVGHLARDCPSSINQQPRIANTNRTTPPKNEQRRA